jgi:hypothetical protein
MANMDDRSRAGREQVRGDRIPANRPENKEPAEGSRETVMNSGGSEPTRDAATEKAIARHARKAHQNRM